MNEFKGWDTCYGCGKLMDDNDMAHWEPMMCCNGQECGCMGLPINPPICIACESKFKKEQNDKVTR